jgi:hypothetical protein
MPVNVEGTVNLSVQLGTGEVRQHPDPLKVNVLPFKYDIGGKRGTYSGVLGQVCADDDSSYLYLNADAALVVSVVGFPTGVTYLPLARVVCANGEIAAIYEERILLASTPAAEGICRIGYPVDGGVRGGGTSASTNNDMPAVRYAHDANGWNRWVGRPPQNYVSGNLVVRILVTLPSSPANGTGTKWQFEYAFRSIDDDLGSYATPVVVTSTFDGTPIADDIWAMDFTLPSGDFDVDADLMFFKVTRLAEDGADDCGKYVYVHAQELRYTGLLLAGQAGQ